MCANVASVSQEERLVGVIDQVIAQVLLGEEAEGEIGTLVDVGIFAHGGGVDHNLVLGHHGAGNLFIGEVSCRFAPRDELCGDALVEQCACHGLGRTASAQHQSTRGSLGNYFLDGLFKSG